MSGNIQSRSSYVSKKWSEWKSGSRLLSWSTFTTWAKRSGLFSLSVGSLIAIALLHLALVINQCGWLSEQCSYISVLDPPEWYRVALLHGPWIVSLPTIGLIDHFRGKQEAWRMRYAICWMVLFGITFGYVGAYHWQGLQDNQSPGETLGAIGLAALGPATLLFVIWRGTLQNQANQIARNQSLPERYQRAARMLRTDDPLVRAGGVHVIEQIGSEFKDYRQMCINSLASIADHHGHSEPLQDDVAAACAAVKRLKDLNEGS